MKMKAFARATPVLQDYRVHFYAVVRVPVEVKGATSQLDAISRAQGGTNLHVDFTGGAYAEDIVSVLVDEVGDVQFSTSTAYEPGQTAEVPWVAHRGAGAAVSASTESTRPVAHRYLDLSTSHLCRSTMDWISAAKPSEEPLCVGITVAPYLAGAFCTVPQDIAAIDALECPDDLKEALRYARHRDFHALRFDTDGDLMDGIPRYE